MATVEVCDGPDIGTLANNYMFVNGLRSALSKTETNVSAVVKSLRVVMSQGCWRRWLDPNGKPFSWSAADFREFIESPWPKGCGVPVSLVIRLLQGTDVLETFLDLIRGNPGGPNNPTGRNQHSEVNRDTVTVDQIPSSPEVIPFDPGLVAPPSPPGRRDYTREAPTGNSVSYLFRRLKKESPDLAEKVVRGEMSAYAAAVQAGFKDRQVSVPIGHPDRVARILVKHLGPLATKELIVELSRAAGFRTETD